MLSLLALSMMITAVAPQNEEREDNGVAAGILLVAGTTATGAVVGAALAGGTSFVALSGACTQEACRDNPQFIVTPLATAAGGVVGAIGGVLLGGVLAHALLSARQRTSAPAAVDDFPDE